MRGISRFEALGIERAGPTGGGEAFLSAQTDDANTNLLALPLGIFRPRLVRLLTGDGRVRNSVAPANSLPWSWARNDRAKNSASHNAEKMKKKANSPVVQVVQLESPLERVSDCRTVPYLRFFLVRNEEVAGSIPVSSTKLPCFAKAGCSIRLSSL